MGHVVNPIGRRKDAVAGLVGGHGDAGNLNATPDLRLDNQAAYGSHRVSADATTGGIATHVARDFAGGNIPLPTATGIGAGGGAKRPLDLGDAIV